MMTRKVFFVAHTGQVNSSSAQVVANAVVEIAPNVQVTVVKTSITQVNAKPEPDAKK